MARLNFAGAVLNSVDPQEVHELRLFAENDGRLYEKHFKPIYRRIQVAFDAGTLTAQRASFVNALAIAFFAAIHKYKREIETDYAFGPAVGRAAAEELMAYVEAELKVSGQTP